jgi:CDP-diacylglycerol--serine O-phosphatidyltransferase
VVTIPFRQAAWMIAGAYVACAALRLARFNVQTKPVPKNPGRPDRKYFVGVPIPAAAGLVAAVVYACHSVPIRWWPFSAFWLGLIALLSFLMVSTWRYRSFKDLSLMRPRSPLTIILVGAFIYLIWNYSRSTLLSLGMFYVGSGIVVRIAGSIRRRFRSGEAHA